MLTAKPAFFSWDHFPFRAPPELSGGPCTDTDVIVAGAGPVGLTLALSMAQQGLRVLLLEARDCVSESSRTLAVARRSVQILDRLGVIEPFKRLAITRERNYLYFGDRVIHSAPYEQSPTEKHPDISVLQQPWTEKILLDAVLAHPLVELRWLNSVVGVSGAESERPRVRVSTPQGEYEVAAKYVVAADGARGSVRRSMNLPYQEIADGVVQRNFVICDFEMKSALPVARRLWVNPPHRPGSAVILHKQPFDTWRLDYSLHDDEDLEEAMRPGNVERMIAAQLKLLDDPTAESSWRLVWISAYRPMSRSLASYRVGRVFFAGDAAHQTPIFGGRGMNQGMLDAANLAWKLAYVLRGVADPRLLDTYDQERRPVIVRNLHDVAQATLCMTATTKGAAIMRKAAFDLLPTEPFVRKLVDAFNANRSESLLTPPPTEGPEVGAVVGSPLPDAPVRVAASGQDQFLHDALHRHGLTWLYFIGADPAAAEAMTSLRIATQASELSRWVSVAAVPLAAADLLDEQGVAFDKLRVQAGTCLLVRPDAYVAARLQQPSPSELKIAWRAALGATE